MVKSFRIVFRRTDGDRVESMGKDKGKTGKKNRSDKKARYGFFMWLTRIIVLPVIKFSYRAKIKKFKGLDKKNCLILFNHQTPFDQFFVLSAFKKTIRLVSTEDVTSNGFASRLLTGAYGIIPIKKQTSDVKAVLECMQIAKNGGTIAVAPEGNRTYSGETCYIRPSIAGLIKVLKLPVVFFKIRGGYGVEPRWSNVKRKGKMTCEVTRVLEYDEYKDLSKDEIYETVKTELYENESDDGEKFYSKKSAEKLERVFYVCPYCGFAEFTSKNDAVTCKKCNRTAKYGADKTFSGDFPFKTVLEWYRFQEDYIVKADMTGYKETPAFTDIAKMSRVIPYVRKAPIFKGAEVSLFSDRITVKSGKAENILPFDKISSVSVLGRNKLNVYFGDDIYQFKGKKSFNALKYMHFYYVYSQKKEGKESGFFFGI